MNGDAFGQSDVGFVEMLTAHAASALENARLNELTRKVRSSLRESEERFTALAQKMPQRILLFIGPEGDFTADEVSLAKKAGCIPVSLGAYVLRVDTAAIVAAAFLRLYAQ
jgi:RsmE family RNA methyltransferase